MPNDAPVFGFNDQPVVGHCRDGFGRISIPARSCTILFGHRLTEEGSRFCNVTGPMARYSVSTSLVGVAASRRQVEHRDLPDRRYPEDLPIIFRLLGIRT
jgi:hypothetical protein